jgi:hypothetical protein
LFHFDLKPRSNYGDSVLFELVRHLFAGYSGREKFLVTGTSNLRHPVGPRTLDWINSDFDAAVLGGGGLMLRSTNENPDSGWQWNISLRRLEELAVPLVVFAVGYNRFEGEVEFEPIFAEHLAATVEKSVFFGLRNRGSIRAVSRYLPPELAGRLAYQPCPTTVASYLVPDLHVPDLEPERRIGLQVTFDPRNELAGYDRHEVFAGLLVVARELHRQGFELDVISHSPVDHPFHEHLRQNGVPARPVRLNEGRRGVYAGLEYYGRLPLTIGMRGHGQMIPFGMGNGIISVAARDKLRYFTEDIGHPELAVDPRGDGWPARVLALVDAWFGDFTGSRGRFAAVRADLWQTTLGNLAGISTSLTGDAGDPGTFVAFTPFERELMLNAYTSSMRADREAERAGELRSELKATTAALARTGAALERSEAELARGGLRLMYSGLRKRARRLLRG